MCRRTKVRVEEPTHLWRNPTWLWRRPKFLCENQRAYGGTTALAAGQRNESFLRFARPRPILAANLCVAKEARALVCCEPYYLWRRERTCGGTNVLVEEGARSDAASSLPGCMLSWAHWPRAGGAFFIYFQRNEAVCSRSGVGPDQGCARWLKLSGPSSMSPACLGHIGPRAGTRLFHVFTWK